MSLLGLWELSIGLSAVSLCIMLGLVIARLISEARERRVAKRRAMLIPKLLAGHAEVSDLTSRGRCDAQSTDLVVELISMVRGKERDNFVDLATRIGAQDNLLRRLSKGTVRLKVAAAEALAHFPGTNTSAGLERALADKSGDVRLAAALALARSDRAPPIRVLVDRLALGKTENSLLLISILQLLTEQRREEVEGLLAADDVEPVVKAAAIEALAASGSFQTAPHINRLALDTKEETDELARYLRALGTLRHPAGIPAVVHFLNATTWWIRAAAAEAAGRIGITDVVPRLAELLGDEDWWVRFRAGEALARLGKPGIDVLRKAVQSGQGFRREAAELTLAELGIARHG